MPLRPNDPAETARQRAALDDAVRVLSDALDLLVVEGRAAAKIAGRGRVPDLTNTIAAMATVRRAEEAVDIAQHDVNTASGEDA